VRTIPYNSMSKYLIFFLLGACVSTGTLNAQAQGSVYKGSFTLPFETRWGPAVLPAGEYSLALNSTAMPVRATIRGENGAVLIQAEAMATRSGSEQSSLILTRRSRRGVVRSLYIAELGTAFYFAVSKAERQVIAQGPELIQRIPVVRTGK
jgi:hypothetical protein